MSRTNALVSCIIPTKNRPELVLKAVTSVLSQTHKNIEIIVVDDSTDDRTRQVLDKQGMSVTYMRNTVSKGACYSRNVGLDKAKGDIIAFLDDDDIWMPSKIEKQLRLLDRYAMVGCNSFTGINGHHHYLLRPAIVTYEEMLYHNYLGSCSYVAVTADAVRGCYFDERLSAAQDWDMWLAIMKGKRIGEAANVSEYLVDYNSGLHSRITNSADRKKAIMTLYGKYVDEHTADSTKLFFLFNMVTVDTSLLNWLFREYCKIRMKKKGLLFILAIIVKRIFHRTVFY